MNKVIKFFLNGTVIFLIAVPFLFSSGALAQDVVKLKLKSDGSSLFNPIAIKDGSGSNTWLRLIKIPAYAGMTMDNEIAALTSFSREVDSLAVDSLEADSNMTVVKPKVPVVKKFRMRKSPTTAVLLSAVLPGAGQFYNESYWKVPIVGGLVGYFGYEYFRNNNLYKDYRDDYAASQTEINPDGDINLKTLREFYRDQRDDFVWYFLIVYVINMVDAYVDAHLFDFDVSEDKFTKGGVRGREYKLKFNLKF